MKRLILRTATLLLLSSLGLIAISQAQRATNREARASAPAADAVPKTVPIVPTANPFAGTPVAEPATVPAATAAQPPVAATVAQAPVAKAAETTLPPTAASGVPASNPAVASAAVPSAAAPSLMPVLPPGTATPVPPTSAAAAPGMLPSSTDTKNNPPPFASGGPMPSTINAPVANASEPRTLALETNPRRLTQVGPAAASAANSGREGSGQPGRKQLDGPQMPQLRVQKSAPAEIQVGKPAAFRTSVANVGQSMAHAVEIRDQVPKGTQLVETNPKANLSANGELVWDLGMLKPGDEVSVEMTVMPVAEGEIGSVATVRCGTEASARTVCTRPQLVVKVVAPPKVQIGEEVSLNITVSNPGTGVATRVALEERIPDGMQHPAGSALEYEIGTLRPGESRQLQLPLTAVKPGTLENVLIAKGDGNLKVEERTPLTVTAPQLEVAMEGPRRRYLEREATYTVSVSNPGTASARQVELVAYLPKGLKFVSANNAGHYEPATQTVHWALEELPARDADKVELVTLPIEAGEQKLRLEGRAEKGLAVQREQPVMVEGIAAVLFEVSDVNDPVEVGREAMYEIRVVNQGSKAATNVRISVIVPPGMKAIAAEGPTRQFVEANQVQFEGLARLAPKAETAYRVRLQGLQPGDQRVKVKLQTDEMQEPVTKEESTRVYKDE